MQGPGRWLKAAYSSAVIHVVMGAPKTFYSGDLRGTLWCGHGRVHAQLIHGFMGALALPTEDEDRVFEYESLSFER